MIPSGITALLTSFVGGLVLTPLARAAARRIGAVDKPDGRRKLQKAPVPLWGGVAVYIALLLGVGVALLTADGGQSLVRLAWTTAIAAGFVTLVGCIDDSFDLNPRVKLLLQCISTTPLLLAGFWIDRICLLGIPLELGWLGAVLTVFWLVACINAVNLLDGMDGLASVVGLSSAMMIAIVSLMGDHGYVAPMALALAGALAAFLVYNLPPASIYLGDSGSMVIGLVVGIMAIQGTQKTSATLSLALPAALLTIPMLDTSLAIVRRRLSGLRFDAADRGHIHHRLLDRGFTIWQALWLIGSLCVITGGAAVAASILQSEAIAWLVAVSVLVVAIRARLFGHYEVALVKLSVANLLARIAQRLIGSLSGRGRIDRARLVHKSVEEVWRLLIEEIEDRRGLAVDVVIGDARRIDFRREWTSSVEAENQGNQWSFSLRLADEKGRYCEVRTVGVSDASKPPGLLLGLDRLLRPFAEHWLAGDLEAAPATISLYDESASSEAVPPQPAVKVRKAA